MSKIRAIIFDFDETLYNGEPFDKWGDFVMNAIKEIIPDDNRRMKFIDKYPQVLGNISSSRLAELFKIELGSVDTYVQYEKDHIYALRVDMITAISNDYLKELAQKFPLVIVSNSSYEHISFYLKEFGISEDNFTAIYQNEFEELGKGKYYLEVKNKFNCNSDEILVLGDNFESDILPAINLGMCGYQVKTLDELKKIIETKIY